MSWGSACWAYIQLEAVNKPGESVYLCDCPSLPTSCPSSVAHPRETAVRRAVA